MKPVILAAAALLIATSAAAAAPKPKEADWRTPDPENILVIDTTKGRVFVELTPQIAPGHVARIKELTREGFYDGIVFHRVIDRFMAQTGDPLGTGEGGSTKPDLKAEFTWRRAQGDDFVTAASPQGLDEGFIGSLPVISQSISYTPVTSDNKVAAWAHYCPGVVGMARSSEEDSGNSQFFLMRQAYPSLDKRYTVFGRVISGEEFVRAIKTGEPVEEPQDQMLRVTVLADWPADARPKVRVIDPHGAWFRGEIARARKARGADFSLCDIDIPVEIR